MRGAVSLLVIIAELLIGIFAMFGVASLLNELVRLIRYRKSFDSSGVRLVLLVKNREESIEGIIRGIYSAEDLGKLIEGDSFTVLDMGSKDGTVRILNRLRKDFGCFNVLLEDERTRIFEDFEKDDGKLYISQNSR